MFKKIWKALDDVFTWPLRVTHRRLMKDDKGRTKSAFLNEFRGNPKKLQIAGEVWSSLVALSPLGKEFSPALDDRFDDIYGIVFEDFDDLVASLLKNKIYAESNIESPIDASTPRGLIEYLYKAT